MRIEEFNEAAKIVDELEALTTKGEHLMNVNREVSEYSTNPQDAPLSFLVHTKHGPEEVTIDNNQLTWKIWEMLVDHLGQAREDKELELTNVTVKPKKKEKRLVGRD